MPEKTQPEKAQPEDSQEKETDETPDADAKPDVPPNRMSIDPSSKHFDEDLLARGVGIRFKGKQRTNVQEYSISEGWVRMTVGKSVDRMGRPLTIKSHGPVEAWFEDLGDEPPIASADS